MLARQVVENTGLQPAHRVACAGGHGRRDRPASGRLCYSLRPAGQRAWLRAGANLPRQRRRTVKALGTRPCPPEGFVMVRDDSPALHSGLPWWLFDMRPQGYLGRAYASARCQPRPAANPGHWRGRRRHPGALLAHGHDAIGNLLIGERARGRFIAVPAPVPVDRAVDYPALARAAGAGELPARRPGASSKFCAYTERGRMCSSSSPPPTTTPRSDPFRPSIIFHLPFHPSIPLDSALINNLPTSREPCRLAMSAAYHCAGFDILPMAFAPSRSSAWSTPCRHCCLHRSMGV